MNTSNYIKICLIALGVCIVATVIAYFLLSPSKPSTTGTEPGTTSSGNQSMYTVSVGSGQGTGSSVGSGQGSASVSGTGGQAGQTSGGERVPLEVKNGATVSARNFINDPQVTEDTSNKGDYFIGYKLDPNSDVSASEAAPYIIVYNSSTHFFNISILREPISAVRKEAEQYLMKTLGLDIIGMCALKYAVSVPNRVNALYAGTNLGFSFCHGATFLP